MEKKRKQSRTSEKPTAPPARTVEGRELQLVDLAFRQAEEQLRSKTASSQVVTHFLQLGTQRASLERLKLEREVELLKAKTETLESSSKAEDLLREAISAFKEYSGEKPSGD